MTRSIQIALALTIATLTACGGSTDSALIGPQGGTVTTDAGVTLKIAPGAIARETEIRITETEPGSGKLRRVELEPRGLSLATPATLSFRMDDRNVTVAEIEHRSEGEIRHELERRHHNGEVEVEVHRFGGIEMEHGRFCAADCGSGFECDDGVCKVHVEDDHGVDGTCPAGMEFDDGICKPHGGSTAPSPAPAPAPGSTTCPAGMEFDDGICKPHGGSTAPSPAPAPAPGPTTCPADWEFDESDGICKPHGGRG